MGGRGSASVRSGVGLRRSRPRASSSAGKQGTSGRAPLAKGDVHADARASPSTHAAPSVALKKHWTTAERALGRPAGQRFNGQSPGAAAEPRAAPNGRLRRAPARKNPAAASGEAPPGPRLRFAGLDAAGAGAATRPSTRGADQATASSLVVASERLWGSNKGGRAGRRRPNGYGEGIAGLGLWAGEPRAIRILEARRPSAGARRLPRLPTATRLKAGKSSGSAFGGSTLIELRRARPPGQRSSPLRRPALGTAAASRGRLVRLGAALSRRTPSFSAPGLVKTTRRGGGVLCCR